MNYKDTRLVYSLPWTKYQERQSSAGNESIRILLSTPGKINCGCWVFEGFIKLYAVFGLKNALNGIYPLS